MAPSTGELPLLDVLRALPRGLPVGLEVPLRSKAEASVGPRERLGLVVENARRLLAQLLARHLTPLYPQTPPTRRSSSAARF